MMSPTKALDYLSWECKELHKKGKLTPKKLEAVNSLISFYQVQNQKAVTDNELFAKLFIEKLMFICETKHATSEKALYEIERILSTDVYEMVLKFKDKIPFFKFNSIGQDTEPLDEAMLGNLTYIRERNNKIIDNHTKELKEALKTSYTEEQAIKFIETQINRLLTKYAKTK